MHNLRQISIAKVSFDPIGFGSGVKTGHVSYCPGLTNLECIEIIAIEAGQTRLLGVSDSKGVITGKFIQNTGLIEASGWYSFNIIEIATSVRVFINYQYEYVLP